MRRRGAATRSRGRSSPRPCSARPRGGTRSRVRSSPSRAGNSERPAPRPRESSGSRAARTRSFCSAACCAARARPCSARRSHRAFPTASRRRRASSRPPVRCSLPSTRPTSIPTSIVSARPFRLLCSSPPHKLAARMGGIRLDGATKVYVNGVTAVDAVSLTIADGEFMVLVGPSGCGKSTLLRMIAGLEHVTEGRIFIGDEDVTSVQPRARDIAMVFQNYALYPQMTVEDNLGFGLKLRRVRKNERERRVTDVARILGLDTLMARKPAALSGGQRQRVAMGRAMVREPKAFLMDEPLSNLDAKLRVTIRAELARLHDRLGVTTVYVTHDQVEAMTLGQRVAVLREGVLQQCDTPQNLFHHPANLSL